MTNLRLLAAAGAISLLSACGAEVRLVGGDEACGRALEDVLGAIGEGVDGMVEASPVEIRGDVRLLVDTYGEALERWVRTGAEPAETAFDTPELAAARDRVGAWLDWHCGDGPAAD